MFVIVNYIVFLDLIMNCVLFLNRHYFIVVIMILPYSIFEMLVPDLY